MKSVEPISQLQLFGFPLRDLHKPRCQIGQRNPIAHLRQRHSVLTRPGSVIEDLSLSGQALEDMMQIYPKFQRFAVEAPPFVELIVIRNDFIQPNRPFRQYFYAPSDSRFSRNNSRNASTISGSKCSPR